MTPEQYETSFRDITEKVLGLSDLDWEELISKHSIPLSRNTLRNACSNVYGSVFVKEYFEQKQNNTAKAQVETSCSLPKYKSETNINKDGSYLSDKLLELTEDDLKDTSTLLLKHGFDPKNWELISAKNSIWNAQTKAGVKNLYFSKINVKPRIDIMSLENIEEWFVKLDRNYSLPKFNYNEKYLEGTKCLLIDIADLHLNLQASMYITGNEYNCEIAENLFFYVINNILSRTSVYNFQKIIFTIGGDILNADNLAGTTTKGTPQNNELHLFEAYERACAMTIKAIDILKQYCPVEVIYIAGNHDLTCGFKLAKYIEAWFRNDDFVTVDSSPYQRKYVKFGKTLFVFAHDGNVKTLPGLVADEGREYWTDIETTEVFLQHLHSEQVLLESNNMRIQRLPTISAKSEWTVSKGLGSKRQCKSFIFDLEDGLTDVLYTPIKKYN